MSKSCDYCDNETKYMAMNGERRCKQCLAELAELPESGLEARKVIVALKKEIESLKENSGLNLLKIQELMDTGFGVDPEIFIFKRYPNFIAVRISKIFKKIRHYREFQITTPVIRSKKENDAIPKVIKYEVAMLQRYIDEIAKDA